MSDTEPGAPSDRIRRGGTVEYEPVEAADGLYKGVLIDESDGAPNFAMRRFVLDPGAEVPKHTNEVEHEQYVLEGEYVVGIGDASEMHRADRESAERSSADRSSGHRPREEAVDGGAEHIVSAGDALLIPAGTVHWYRNEGEERGAFLCVVPNGDDAIELAETNG